MKEYYDYIEGVLSGRIRVSQYIRQQVERTEAFKKRPDLYFDEECVQDCFDFIRQMKHFAGKTAGQQFELLPWQKWVIGSVIGIKYKDTGLRVCRDLFILVARKNGKSSLIAALSLYMLIADGEAAPSIGCVANSTQQARILFEMIQNYSKTLDPQGNLIKNYRNYIKFAPNLGEIKVFSSDSSRLDGLNLSLSVADETHSYKDNKLISVLRSSQGFREAPLMVQISTCGFLTDGYPCFETYKMSIEVLSGVKTQDEFFPFLYVMDPDDDWTDEDNWIKCNPCLDVTVTREYLRQQATLAKNDSTQMVPIKTKNFNIWCSSADVWIPVETVAKSMQELNLEDFRGATGYVALDLGSVSDLTALSLMIRQDEKFYFWNWGFVPRDTFVNSPNHELYERFREDGDLIISEGNVFDQQVVINKIIELNQIVNIQGIYYDQWNSTQVAINLTDMGYPMHPVRQGLMAFSNPTKEFERAIKSGEAVIDKSTMFLYEMGNCYLRQDAQMNCKPDKNTNNQKIDNVIAAIMALAGWLGNPVDDDFEVFVF